MRKRNLFFNIVFSLLGGMLLLFIVLPLMSILLGTTPQTLWLALMDEEVLNSIVITFSAAAVATLLAIFTGVPLAFLLARRKFRGKRLLEALVNLPIVIPHTAAGVALLLVFGRRGLLGQWLTPLGITFTDNFYGIVVGMLFVSLPFLVNLSRESFALVDEELERVALIDGASPWQAFWYVSLPQAWRGVLAGALMMWARGISEFGAVVILAYHPKIVPVLVFERFQGFGLVAAQPVAALLILIALAAFVFLQLSLPKESTD
ncbi:ABC transporter permease [Candidatus Villigracilis saccharophilus]|uniref:ABC transporter permease n=1 Tax=Candidatus Villigracilis saccharophilus TaxID=3140684 RepID=UPI0031E6B9F8